MSETKLEAAVSLPSGFRFGEVSSLTALRAISSSVPGLGPLANFTGTFAGNGFNTIFRPDSAATPTPLPIPVAGSDNVLELNLTSETLSFSKSLGSVPNRGMMQGDVFLNGIPYLQSISDITVPSQPTGIHLEPGLWMIVPTTTDPAEGQTLVRMASIPHGTTIVAQGTSVTIRGKPTIPAVDITPFTTAPPNTKIPFPSQTATNKNTARIPQDLTSFIAAGTITQAMLTDPNTLLRNHIASQNVTSTTTISVSTSPAAPLFGGGTDNIAFLLGDAAALTNPAPAGPNAQTLKMNATFWIETVEHVIVVPIFKPGHPPLTIPAETGDAGQPVPRFLVNPPIEITAPRRITVQSTQIQYSQEVFLNFNTLTWPHVSVATLVQSDAIPVPPSVWT
ncbi:MAG TPA: heme-binding protein [Acetobacteraceae bacterium]|nr:heme-binding protein [Acetobacteraceae bacterium]